MSDRKPTPDLMGGIDIMDDILLAGAKTPTVSWHGKELDYPIDRIQVGKRMRPLGDIATLTESISQIGLLNPINILPDGTLIAGNHRLAAAKALGWTQIRVRVVELSEVDAELAEIDENLRRNNLTVLEEAEHLLRREELLEAKGLRAASGTNLRNLATGAPGAPVATTTDIAKSMGLSERTAQERLQIARNIDTEAKAAIRANEDIANSTKQLLELARQPAERQRTIADMLMSGKASNVNEAVRLLAPTPAPTPVKVEYWTPAPAEVSPELPAWAKEEKPEPTTYAQIWQLEGLINGLSDSAEVMRKAAQIGSSASPLWGSVAAMMGNRQQEFRKSDLVQAFNNVAAQLEAKANGTNRPNLGTAGSVPSVVAAEPIYAEIHVLAGLIRGFRFDAEDLRAAIAEGEANPTYAKITEIMKSARVHWREDDLLVAIHTIAGEVEARKDIAQNVADDILNPVPVSFKPDYDSDEWYTPAEYIEAARKVMGSIDLDPASCVLAQTVVKADVYLTKAENGLRQQWIRNNVWLNPPYSDPSAWVQKAISEFDKGTFVKQAVLLVNNATETGWFQALLVRFPVCFLDQRIPFWRHDQKGVTARQGQAVFYLGPNQDKFIEVFKELGPIMRRIA